MIKSLIFDFDGVVVDSEPLHFRVFQQVLKDEGIELSEELYFSKYLAFDDKTFFTRSLSDFGKYTDSKQVFELIEKKSAIFEPMIEEHVKVFPGVQDFLRKVSGEYPVAIGSGALRSEIELILKYTGLENYFDFIVSANEVENCKPDPEVYNRVLDELNKRGEFTVSADECVVFEDSVHGMKAAKSAGMYCVAVSNSYDKDRIDPADITIKSFIDIDESFLKNFK